MFESIIFRKSFPGNTKVDVGLLAECLLFYNKVLLVADTSMVKLLVKDIGLDAFEELITNNHLDLIYSPAVAATYAGSENSPEEYFDFISVLKVDPVTKRPDYERLFHEALQLGSGKRGKSRRIGNRLLEKVKIIDSNDLIPIENGFHEISRKDLEVYDFTKTAVKVAIENFAPTFHLPSDFEFKVKRHEKGFKIFTNLDLDLLNKACSRLHFPDKRTILSRAMLVDCILKANENIYLACHHESEIVTGSVISEIISLKCKEIIQKTSGSAVKVDLFQKVVISESKSLREAINSGEKTLIDLVPLLDKSHKFKDWVHSKPVEANLIEEYYKAINADSWVNKLPAKTARFAILTGGGIALDTILTGGIATACGIALGIADTFFLEKIAKGWRPNQFVAELSCYLKK